MSICKTACPVCTHRIAVVVSRDGGRIQCPRCSAPLVVAGNGVRAVPVAAAATPKPRLSSANVPAPGGLLLATRPADEEQRVTPGPPPLRRKSAAKTRWRRLTVAVAVAVAATIGVAAAFIKAWKVDIYPDAMAATSSPSDKRSLIEEFIRLTKQEELTRVSQIEGFKSGLGPAGDTIPAETQSRLTDEWRKISEEILPWETVKEDVVVLYDRECSEEELREMVSLCRDVRFSAYVDKQIALVGPAFQMGQRHGARIMPKIMEAAQRILSDDVANRSAETRKPMPRRDMPEDKPRRLDVPEDKP